METPGSKYHVLNDLYFFLSQLWLKVMLALCMKTDMVVLCRYGGEKLRGILTGHTRVSWLLQRTETWNMLQINLFTCFLLLLCLEIASISFTTYFLLLTSLQALHTSSPFLCSCIYLSDLPYNSAPSLSSFKFFNSAFKRIIPTNFSVLSLSNQYIPKLTFCLLCQGSRKT